MIHRKITCIIMAMLMVLFLFTSCANEQSQPVLENTVENLFHHVVSVTCDEKGRWLPARFSAEEIALLGQVNPKFANNGRCAAGVSLKFYTDAPEISFTYNAEVLYTKIGGFDIYENGELMATEVLRSVGGRGKIEYTKHSDGETLIEIYLPNNAEMTLWDFSLGDNWRVVPKEELLVCYYGDSITQSAYVETPSMNFATIASGIAGTDYINRGVGALFYDVRSLPETDTIEPGLIFVEFGANDLAQHHEDGSVVVTDGIVQYCTTEDVPQLIENAKEYLEKLSARYPKALIQVISVPWAVGTLTDERQSALDLYNAQLQMLAEELSMGFVDGAAMNPHDPSLYHTDGIHLNAQGGKIFGESLAAYIKK